MDDPSKFARIFSGKPLRLWPGIVIVIIQWLLWYAIPALIPVDQVMMIGVGGSLLCGVAIVIWWAFLSRARWFDRLGGLILAALSLYAVSFLLDKSITTSNMGLMFIMYSLPVTSIFFVAGLVVTGQLSPMTRRVVVALFLVGSAGLWAFLRTDGMNGVGEHELNWRWARSSEQRLLLKSTDLTETGQAIQEKDSLDAEWPGFRGPNRDGIVHGVMIGTDWEADPPQLMWRKQVGPGCSSFSIRGNLFYTQEQRGDVEMVSCYDLRTGEPVWQHGDSVRFWDSHAGAGPRSTPTLDGSRVYSLGGTGLLNVLNASDGSKIWSRDAAKDAGITVLTWGFTSSPLVVGNVVIVALAGKLAVYDTSGGLPLWFGPDGGSGYSSPQFFTLGGVPQVILMSASGAISFDPASGNQLWEYSWPIEDRILQPALIGGEDLLLSQEYTGVRRVTVTQANAEYTITERWTSSEMKVNFNDNLVYNGYAFGFDGPSIACLDLKEGKRLWKGERYRGFTLLLAGQNLILVLSEKGELALVNATPEKFTELGKIQAIEGKTWNHPAIARNILLVRNSQEMAAFKLPPASGI
ncbi:MAG: PQQ-like beta-propeller repeat protein [Bacteroidales bacterium]|nr:PQQ-like beta-propeller repeat protein [Bacteroidales bacterium]